MSLGRPGRETSVDVEDIDGYQFVSFERVEELHDYLKQTVHCRRQSAPPRLGRGNVLKPPKARAKTSKSGSSAKSNAGRSSTTPSSSARPKVSKAKTGAGDAKKVPVWLKHKRRLRKSDKRVVVDKFHGFVFASAFTVDDFDAHKEELASEVSPAAAPGAKRKASPTTTQTTAVPAGEKKYKRSTKELDGGNLVTSNLLNSTARPAGKKLGKDAVKKFAKDAGMSDAIPASLGMSNLDRLKTFTSSIVPPTNDALLSMVDQASEPFHPGQYAAETTKDQKLKMKDRKKQYPHMQIDEAYNRTVSSPSGSESSVITISDEGPDQDNIILDVINVDDELSSAQFIQDSIKMVNDNQPSLELNKDKAKRKKCRICCIYPSKIVEAKKIGPLFGSVFPSYAVSCVSTCKQHPPGDIIVMPSTSKPGCVDTCIQTNAPDIRMNLDFAHRFPHRTIAIMTHSSKMLTQPTPRTKRAKFFNKSEHHRSSEQKRREQMHDQFTDLRKIITTSQAIPDNERASKQWILEHAMMAIASLEAESAVLVALKKTVAARNERLKSKWRDLSGMEFDTNIHWCNVPSQSSGETKLINLYKQYRKNVQRKDSNKTSEVEFNQSAVTTQPTEQSVTTSKNQSQAMVEVSLVRQSSGTNTGKQPGGETVMDTPKQMKSKEAVSGNVVGQDLSTSNVNHPSRATVTSNPSQASSMKMLNAASTVMPGRPNEAECRNPASKVMVTSNPSQVTCLDKQSHDACEIMERISEAVIFTKPNQASSVVSANTEQPSTNNPIQKVPVAAKLSQTITGAPNNSSQNTSSSMPNQPYTPSVPVSSQLPIPVMLSSHPRAVRNPDPTISVNTPSQTATTSIPTSSQPSMPVMLSSHPRAVRMPSHTMTTSVPPEKVASPPTAVSLNPTMVRMPTLALRMPPSSRAITMNVGTQFLAVSRANQPTGPRLLIPLSKLNQALMSRKPTQWTAMSKLSQQEVNKLHVEDVGAIVEVGAGQLNDNKEKHKNDIVLLDVAQTEQKSASSEQGRTLSLIPTSSSINVTLKSVGSITSNKIFNKKPVPSKQNSLVGLQVGQANNRPAFIPKPVNETNAFKTGPALEPVFDQVPQISETLLAQTFQDRNIGSTNETGLCVISNVFSLSNIEIEGTSEPAMDSGKCDKSDSEKQLGKNVDVNCNSTTHDHNYCEA